MKCKNKKRIISALLALALAVSLLPGMTSQASETDNNSYVHTSDEPAKVSDPYSGNAYESIFYPNGRTGISTENAGRVWTDKSVLGSGENAFGDLKKGHQNSGDTSVDLQVADDEFLVGLSTIASNEVVLGVSNKPTDTMIILDLSSSMYNNGNKNPKYFQEMAKSVNDSITKLQTLNAYNRVGVTIYYGGGSYDQASANSGKVMLPLGRYQAIGGKYIEATTSNGELVGLQTVSKLKTEENVTVDQVIHTCPVTAGTYAQLGILYALDEFMRKDISPEAVIDGKTVERTPVFVFMSDGTPTAASKDYTMENGKVQADIGCNTNAFRSAPETDFLTQLTAAYARAKVDEKYVNTTPLYYTLTLGSDISVDIMDPKAADSTNSGKISDYWNRLLASRNGITITGTVCAGTWDYTQVNKKLTVAKNPYITSVNQRFFVDKNFVAAKGDNLADAFDAIVSEINMKSKYYPTLVDGDDDFTGNVSFVDRLGEYMHMTAVKGLVVGGKLYTGEELASRLGELNDNTGTGDSTVGDNFVWALQKRLGISDVEVARALIRSAYKAGQLAYSYDELTGTVSYSNYIGWLANENGVYVAPWNESVDAASSGAKYIVKSFYYLGEPAGYNIDTDMMYATVQWRQDIATGEEMVTFAVPVSLLPTITYMVQLDDDGDIESLAYESGDDQLTPIRLLYTVALDDNINNENVMDVVGEAYTEAKDQRKNANGEIESKCVNKDADGNIYFYTNDYETDYTVGYKKVNTYSYFRPSYENSKYYYQADKTIYADEKGTPYKGSEKPAAGGNYYRKITVYEKTNEGVNSRTDYSKLTDTVLEAATQSTTDGTWYIPKGTAHFDHETYMKKDSDGNNSNNTKTFEQKDIPYVDLQGDNVSNPQHRYVIGATLGNNGFVRIQPSTGISIEKEVSNFAGNDKANSKEFTFEIQRSGETESGTYTGKRYDSAGNMTTENVVFTDGEATVTLKHGEKLYITGMKAGRTYTVTEQHEDNYVVSEVNGEKVNGTETEVTTVQNKIVPIKFTNTARGTGSVTISKVVTHEMGTEYKVPDQLEFEINGTVTLDNGTPAAKKTYTAKKGNTDLSVTTDDDGKFSVSLKHGESITIQGLPEKAQVTVVENLSENQKNNFTISYEENGKSAKDGDIVIGNGTTQSLKVCNAYTPKYESVTTNIKISGTKSFKDAAGTDKWNGEEFTIKLQKREGDSWVDVESATVTQANQNYTISKELSFGAIGTYAYQIVEMIPDKQADYIVYDSTVYSFSVIVTDEDMDGALEVKTVRDSKNNLFTYENGTYVKTGVDFDNTYVVNKPAEVKIDINKEMSNPSGSNLAVLSGYQFGIYGGFDESTGNVTGNALTTTAATNIEGYTNATLHFYLDGEEGNVFTRAYKVGDTETFYVKEIAGTQSNIKYSGQIYKVDVAFKDGGNGTLVGEPTYSVFDAATNEWNAFNPEGDGLTFTNEYTVQPTSLTLDVCKELTGKTLEADMFEFQIKADTEGAPMPAASSVKNGADGTVNFGTITYDKVGTYEYTVTEVVPSDAVQGADGRFVYQGIVYDPTEFHVVVNVSDKGAGVLEATHVVYESSDAKIVFHNAYEPAPAEVVINGTKTLNGRDLKENEFVFELEAVTEGAPMPSAVSVKNRADGTFAFGAIRFEQSDCGKTYQYRVTEQAGDESYMTYDKSVYDVTVEVKDDGVGNVVATVTYTKDGNPTDIEFVNTYDKPGTTPDKPTPDKPGSSEPTKGTDSAKTGDSSAAGVWLAVMLLAAGSIIALLLYRKRNNRR